jgi:predicted dinucleotide-binding enzyme
MKSGMIDSGTLSRAIAGHSVKAAHDVVISNSRGPETLKEIVDAFGPDLHLPHLWRYRSQY